MQKLKIFFSNNYLPIILFFFSVFICHFTGNRGVFPIDSFSHFDNAFRILKGDHPFKDYWVVSGPFIDYLQSLIFLIFGINWQTYILSASLLNGILSLIIYSLFKYFGLHSRYSFFYAACFSILAYPSSGTPFVDHHSTFLSILTLNIFIWSMIRDKAYQWFLIPILMVFAFLSKQVPSTYIFFIIIIILSFHLIFQTKKKIFKILSIIFISSFSSIIFFFLFLNLNNIEFQNFLIQYIYYPRSLGGERFYNLNYDFKNLFLDFKFIYLSLILLTCLIINNLINQKNYYKKINFKTYLIFLFLFLVLIQHISMTKNQIFIFFLIPIFTALAHIELLSQKKNFAKFLRFFLLFICLATTIKYHYRFNIERKFHELSNVNFINAVGAEKLDKKFGGLNWITPNTATAGQVKDEMNYIIKVKEYLEQESDIKMLITNYSFFSILLNKNVGSYTRWFPGDNSAFPKQGNNYEEEYKNFISEILNKKKIESIYILPDVSETYFTDYIDPNCYDKKLNNLKIIKFKINYQCSELFLWKKK